MPSRTTTRLLGVLLIFSAWGCAGPNQIAATAPRIPFSEIADGRASPHLQKLQAPPVVIHVQAGQKIPGDFAADSKLLAVEGGDFTLVAKRDFYVLFRTDGPPLLSEDGVEFEDQPRGTFMIGLRVLKDQPATVQLRVGVRPEGAPPAAN